MKRKFFILPLAALLLALVGCQSFRNGVPQEVVIISFPSEASVYIDGEAVGITPLTTSLRRKMAHSVRLEKNGYNVAQKYIVPTPNDKSTQLIRFGLSEDLGYYVDLTPRQLEAKMKSGLVPASTGSDPFETMAQRALEADQKLEAGEITPLEHKYIIEQIIEFFEKAS
jgi:PEGA domain.